MVRSEKISEVARLQGELLRNYKVGHPDWYAEMLVCAATNGQLALTNCPNYDVLCESLGRIQVKCRVNGTDTTQNRTNFGKYAVGDFDHAVIVIFESDYRIMGAVVLSAADVLLLVRKAGHVKWHDVISHANAVCMREKLRSISCEKT